MYPSDLENFSANVRHKVKNFLRYGSCLTWQRTGIERFSACKIMDSRSIIHDNRVFQLDHCTILLKRLYRAPRGYRESSSETRKALYRCSIYSRYLLFEFSRVPSISLSSITFDISSNKISHLFQFSQNRLKILGQLARKLHVFFRFRVDKTYFRAWRHCPSRPL